MELGVWHWGGCARRSMRVMISIVSVCRMYTSVDTNMVDQSTCV